MKRRLYLSCPTEQDMKLAMDGLFHAKITVIGFLHARHPASANNRFIALFSLYHLLQAWAMGLGVGVLCAGGLALMLTAFGIPAIYGWDVVGLVCVLLAFFSCWLMGFVAVNRVAADLSGIQSVLLQQAYVVILAPCEISLVRQVCDQHPQIHLLDELA